MDQGRLPLARLDFTANVVGGEQVMSNLVAFLATIVLAALAMALGVMDDSLRRREDSERGDDTEETAYALDGDL